jgi:hypothetical protein
MRKRIRRRDIADAFRVNIRTPDGWVKRGIIPPPHYYEGSNIPFWFEDEIDGLPSNQSDQSKKATA